jgi:type II secretory pathway pseudopilin PulG
VTQLSGRKQKGFSIIELVVVAGIFVASVASFFGASYIAFRAVTKASDKVQAAYLLEEGVEGVRYLRDISWKKFIDPQQLGYEKCLLFDSASRKYNISSPNVIGLWHLDESGDSPLGVVDYSGKNNGGTFTFGGDGGMFASDNTKASERYFAKNAARFDGNDSIQTTIVASTLMSGINSFTLESWVKQTNPAAPSAVQRVITGSGSAPSSYGSLILNNGKPQFQVPAGGDITGDMAIDSSWHHIAGVFNYTGPGWIMTLYLDGGAVKSISGSGAPLWSASSPFYIGVGAASEEYFNGNIDEVVIYNRALSADEVLDRYNGYAVCSQMLDGYFKRTISFLNVCRSTEGSAPGTKDDIIGETFRLTCDAGYVDNANNSGTKKMILTVRWGVSSEKLEMYLTDLFRN